MNRRPFHVHATINEAYFIAKERFTKYAQHVSQQMPSEAHRFCKDAFDYDPDEFLQALVLEMFDQLEAPVQNRLLRSIMVLVRDGMDQTSASKLSLECFTIVIDHLSATFPELRFSDVGQDMINYSSGGDVLITIPPPEWAEPPQPPDEQGY